MPVRLLVERYCHQMHAPVSRQKPYSYLIHARHSVFLRVPKVLLTEGYATSQRSVKSHEWGRRYNLLSLTRVPTLNNEDGTGCLSMPERLSRGFIYAILNTSCAHFGQSRMTSRTARTTVGTGSLWPTRLLYRGREVHMKWVGTAFDRIIVLCTLLFL